ncbi:hypothetical protein HYW82_04350 [Candidatus Peregrinibacteria bacterium]|nr:hypothetical protein [Candidatus Peregrinibacteria bacterium]
MRWNRRGRVREESDEARDIQLARQHAVSQILEKINQKKDPQKTTDKSGKPSDITIEDIEQARRSGITEVAGEAKADILAVQRLVARIRTASSQIINSANQLADFDRQTVANALNGMTQPVELVRTRLEKGIFSAAQLHRLVDDIAINNSETNQVENKIKKTFLGRIEKSGVEHFGVDTRYRIAIAIATSTDANNDISTNEIASLLEIPATTIAGSMSLLKKSLKDIGITLITQYRKVRIGTRRELEKIPFYRMSERNTNSEKKKQYIAPSAIGFKAMTSDKNLDKVTGDLCEALKRFFSSNVEITNVKHSPSDDAIIVLEKTGQRSFRISSNIKNFAQRAAVCMPALAGMIRDALGLPEADLTLKDID